MRAQKRPVHMADFTGQAAIGAQPFNDTGIIAIWHKANILAIRLVGHIKTDKRSKIADFILGQFSKREAQKIKLLLRCRKQEIGLVARQIAWPMHFQPPVPCRVAI